MSWLCYQEDIRYYSKLESSCSRGIPRRSLRYPNMYVYAWLHHEVWSRAGGDGGAGIISPTTFLWSIQEITYAMIFIRDSEVGELRSQSLKLKVRGIAGPESSSYAAAAYVISFGCG